MFKPNRKFLYIIVFAIAVCFFCTNKLLAQTSQNVAPGNSTAAANFPVCTCTYTWTNDKPSIGLAASGGGNISSFTATNTTASPITATITATPVAPSPQPPLLYIPNFNANNVSVINANTNTLLTTVPVGMNPYDVMVSNDYNTIWVSNQTSNNVSVIHMEQNQVEATITGLQTPRGIAIRSDNQRVYVANSGSNTVAVVDALNFTVSGTITVGHGPIGVSLTHDDSKLYVSNNLDGTVSVINTATQAILQTITVGASPAATILSPDESKLYVVEALANQIAIVNTTNYAVSYINIGAGTTARGIAVDPTNNNRLYVADATNNQVLLFDPSAGSLLRAIPVGSQATGLSISLDGSLLYVTNGNGNSVSVINTSTFVVTPTVAVGTTPYSVGNFYLPRADCSPVTFTITVSASTSPVLTATGAPGPVSTVYGTASPSSSFQVSGANLTGPVIVTAPAGFEVSTISNANFGPTATIAATNAATPKTVYIRLQSAASAGPHSGTIDISSTGATDVTIAMPQSTVSPLGIIINLYGSKTYGDVFPANFTATPSNSDFSHIQQQLVNGEQISSLDITITAGYAANAPAGTYTAAINAINAQGINGFLASNYSITYSTGTLTVNPEQLTITATNITKPNGAMLTGGAVNTGFSFLGQKNGEVVTGVTVTYGAGAAANAAAGMYTGSIVLSNATGTNGFLASNYAITYVPGTITVSAAGPFITASGNLTPLNTVYGTPSTAETFTVMGSTLTAGVLVTPPNGFEVSTDDINFNATVAVGGGSGSVNQLIYIRLKTTSPVNTYGGNIVMSSTNAVNYNLLMPLSNVTPAPLQIIAILSMKPYGKALAPGPGYTQFVVGLNQLKNSETVSSVTVAYNKGGQQATAVVGTYTGSITISQPIGPGTFLASNYMIVPGAANLIVAPANLTATADNQNRVYGQPNPTLTFTLTGFVNGEDQSILTTQPTASTTATLASAPGQYPITVSGGVAPNYIFNHVSGILTVNAIPGQPISIPNTFTPNGDGVNDVWNITNLYTYPQSHLQIFSRNGALLFNSIGYTIPWTGKYNGKDLPAGTYYYVLTLQPGNEPVSGFVAIIR